MERKKFLEYKHHKILMGLREERDPEGIKTNKELEERARAGEDEAFFQLLERNPEFLKTDLAMGKIMEWQHRVDTKKRDYGKIPCHDNIISIITPQKRGLKQIF